MEAELPIIISTNKQKYNQFDSTLLVNLYQTSSPTGKKEKALYQTPGYSLLSTPPGGASCRAMYVSQTYMYMVSGDRIYRFNDVFTIVDITASLQLGTTSGYVGIDSNQNEEVIFVDGQNGYIYDEGANTFVQITSPNFPASPIDVTFMDGRFLVVNSTSSFYISDINNGTSWSVNNIGSINTKPDIAIAIRSIGRQIFIFGARSIEVWYNAGTGGFPFRRNNSYFIDEGCVGAASISRKDNLLIWKSQTESGRGSIMASNGGAPIRISNESIDNFLDQMPTTSDAIGFQYKIANDIFYQITFPTADQTFVYNRTNQLWSKIEGYGGGRHKAQAYAYFSNTGIIGLHDSQSIYTFSENIYQAAGLAIKRSIITPHFNQPNYNRIRINKIEIDYTKGIANSSGPGSEPFFLFGVSADGGVTYRRYGLEARSKIGEYRRRTVLRRLGTARNFVFKLEWYDPLDCAILGGRIWYEGLPT